MKLPPFRILEIAMVFLYGIAGALFLFTDVWKEYIHEGRGLFGGICIVYAVFRSTVIWRKIQNEKHKRPNEDKDA